MLRHNVVASDEPHQPVVCNTSPLINLAGVGLLHLLPALYGTILIPNAVHTEYAAGMRAGDPRLEDFTWIKVVPVDVGRTALPAALGAGETEVILLAIAENARAVLLDEQLARSVARKHGLAVVGTLAVLLAAKQSSLIAGVRPILDTMIAQGRHISERLYGQILTSAGEEG